jgi:hypothetical protein
MAEKRKADTDAEEVDPVTAWRRRPFKDRVPEPDWLALALATHDAGGVAPLSVLCAALTNSASGNARLPGSRWFALAVNGDDAATRAAATLLMPLASPAFAAFARAGGTEPEEQRACGETTLSDYVYALYCGIRDGAISTQLACEALRSHLSAVAAMLRCAPVSFTFSLAAACLCYGLGSMLSGDAAPETAAERVILACAAPLFATLPRLDHTSASTAHTLEVLLEPPRGWVRRGEEESAAAAHEARAASRCAAFVNALGVDALVRLVAALRDDAFFVEHARAPALRLLCALAARDDSVRAALLDAGLSGVLVAALGTRDGAADVAPLLQHLVETCAPLAEAAFAAGAASALVAALDAACEHQRAWCKQSDAAVDAAVRALKSASRAGFAPRLRAAGAVAPLVHCFALCKADTRGLERAVATLHAVLSPANDAAAHAQLRDHAVVTHVVAAPGALAALMCGAGRQRAAVPARDVVTHGLSWCAWLLRSLAATSPDAGMSPLLSAALLDATQPLVHLPALLARGGRMHTLAVSFIHAAGHRPPFWSLLAAPPPARAVPAALAALALAEASAAPPGHDRRFLRLLAEGDGKRIAMCVQAGLSAFARCGDLPDVPAIFLRVHSGAVRSWREQARGGGHGDSRGTGTAGVLRRLLALAEEPLSDAARIARLVSRAVAAVVASDNHPALTQLAARALAAAADTRTLTADAEERAQWVPLDQPTHPTLQQTLCAAAAAGCGPLVASVAVTEVLRRIAAGESVGAALRECCLFDRDEEGRAPATGCACCDRRGRNNLCRGGDGSRDVDMMHDAPRLSDGERIIFEEALVGAFTARMRERLSWERNG